MKKQYILILVLALFVLSASGCGLLVAGAAGGAGTAYWLANKLSDEVSAPYERTISAAKSALNSMDMALVQETKSDTVAQLISKYKDGSQVWIDIRPVTSAATKIEIRVGIRGDKAASNEILERIKAYL